MIETHAWRRALVSSEARPPAGSLSTKPCVRTGPTVNPALHGGAPGIRTQITRGLNALALPLGLERHGVSDGVRTRGLDVGNVARYLLRHAHAEPSGGIEPPPSVVPGPRSAH